MRHMWSGLSLPISPFILKFCCYLRGHIFTLLSSYVFSRRWYASKHPCIWEKQALCKPSQSPLHRDRCTHIYERWRCSNFRDCLPSDIASVRHGRSFWERKQHTFPWAKLSRSCAAGNKLSLLNGLILVGWQPGIYRNPTKGFTSPFGVTSWSLPVASFTFFLNTTSFFYTIVYLIILSRCGLLVPWDWHIIML